VVGAVAWALSTWNATGQERREAFRVIANPFLACLSLSQRAVSQPVFSSRRIERFLFESLGCMTKLPSLDLDPKSLTSSLRRIGTTVIGFLGVVVMKTQVLHRCPLRVEGTSAISANWASWR
jgi:hypothetical protein